MPRMQEEAREVRRGKASMPELLEKVNTLPLQQSWRYLASYTTAVDKPTGSAYTEHYQVAFVARLDFSATIGQRVERCASPYTASHSLCPQLASLGFDLFDLEIWHHWSTVVCYTLSEDGENLFLQNVHKIAFGNAYVAQLILAVSALHLARKDATRRLACITRSNAHQSSAINGMMAVMSDDTNKNCTELYMAACMLVFCSFGKGPQPGQYLAYSDYGEPQWLGLLNGVKSILEQNRSKIYPEVRPTFEPDPNISNRAPTEEVLPGFSKQFDRLRQSIELLQAEDPSFKKYLEALERLHECYVATFEYNGQKGIKISSHMVFAFLYRCKEEYTSSIQSKRPMALVILAHYLVLLAQLKKEWYLEGWVPHIMAAIRSHLHPTYKHWLAWPSQHV
ncbi:hypothetical protein AC578_1127 [Pseudocercospora eumusae]|uniref:Transcription factor domain-containing protein n=1 Tax=Pseudocercospora eumusae TaxID=321146 RepID=A0A139HJP9_9PEZI|nr:hypothetical protein AC578_1127 [Pseudocercospora eumusae]